MPFQEGNQEQRKGHKSKPFRDMLRIAVQEAVGDQPALRRLAEALVAKGMEGDVSAIKEIADRLDGKVPQAVVGDENHPPVMGPEWTDDQRARALASLMAKTSNGQPSGD